MKSFRTAIKESAQVDTGCFGVALGGSNWIDVTSESSENFNSSQTDVRYAKYTPERIAKQLVYEYYENEWGSFLIKAAVNWLFTGYEFTGKGADRVNNFFDTINPTAREEIRMAGWSTVLAGSGFLFKFIKEGKLFQVKYVTHENWDLQFASNKPKKEYKVGEKAEYDDPTNNDNQQRYIAAVYQPDLSGAVSRMNRSLVNPNGTIKAYYFRQYPRYKPEDYRNDKLCLLQLEREHNSPDGYALARSSLHAIKSLKEINRNIPAILKRTMSSILAVYLDTSTIKPSETKTVAKAFSRKMGELNSATIGGIALDSKNRIGYVGGLEGSGPGTNDSRMLVASDYIEPLLTAVLLNFMIPLGIVEQTGANKSLIARQEVFVRKQLMEIQNRISVFMKTQILCHIPHCEDVEIRWKPYLEAETVMQLYETGIITREYANKYLEIVDEGKHYTQKDAIALAKTSPPQQSIGSSTVPKKTDGNNSDKSKVAS